MKKLLLIGLVTGVLAFVPAQRSDAQVYFSVGFGGPGYYGYYPYRYSYYRPYRNYGYYRPYYRYGGRGNYYRHHRYHHYYRR
jgi:hypothetical protein